MFVYGYDEMLCGVVISKSEVGATGREMLLAQSALVSFRVDLIGLVFPFHDDLQAA